MRKQRLSSVRPDSVYGDVLATAEVLWRKAAAEAATAPARDKLTYYQILGVERDANANGIKNSYRTLAREWHPDVLEEGRFDAKFVEARGGVPSKLYFKSSTPPLEVTLLVRDSDLDKTPMQLIGEYVQQELNAAYATLSDPTKKAQYDASLGIQQPAAAPEPVTPATCAHQNQTGRFCSVCGKRLQKRTPWYGIENDLKEFFSDRAGLCDHRKQSGKFCTSCGQDLSKSRKRYSGRPR